MQTELRPLWEREVGRASGPRPRLRLVALAALLVVAVGAALILRLALEPETLVVADVARLSGTVTSWEAERSGRLEALTEGAVLTVGRSLATDEDARVALSMVTGHSLRLDRGTRVAFLSERELLLEQGAIYVDSGSSEEIPPISVVTALGRVEEIGTQFEIRLNGGGQTVRVREGAVSFEVEGQRHLGRAGEQLTLTGGGVRRSRIEPGDAAFDWTQTIAPGWSLDGSRLTDFLDWVSRESGRAVVYSDDGVAATARDVVLSGDVEGLAPVAALDVVLPAVGLSHRLDGQTLVIERR